jgi:hypothetical protein
MPQADHPKTVIVTCTTSTLGNLPHLGRDCSVSMHEKQAWTISKVADFLNETK